MRDLRHSAAARLARDPQLSLTDVQWVLGHALRVPESRSWVLKCLMLRHEVVVLRRQVTQPGVDWADRAALAGLARLPPRPTWRGLSVRPERLLRWHRDLVRRRWSYPDTTGRPALAAELRPLLLGLTKENPTWGYRRIHDELCRLGYHRKIGASTVWTILHRAGVDPAPARPAVTQQFLRTQATRCAGRGFLHRGAHRQIISPTQ